MGAQSEPAEVVVRPLEDRDLGAADRVMRLAFGTFLGLPDPASFLGDGDLVRSRWRADPTAAFAAEIGGELVGSNFATSWGSVGFFGPLTIRPDCWDRGVGKRLMEPVMECFERWGTRHAGLFTFAHSPKHVGLYQRFGFWPRFLTAILSKAVERPTRSPAWARFSELADSERAAALNACRGLTESIYEGLDVRREIAAVAAQKLGETVMVWTDGALAGFAVCHFGAGSEGGSGTCFVKFGAARPGPGVEQDFDRLLAACEDMAAGTGLTRIVAGMNLARHEAYRAMFERKFRTDFQGVAMHRPNDAGYHRPGVFLVDDWR